MLGAVAAPKVFGRMKAPSLLLVPVCSTIAFNMTHRYKPRPAQNLEMALIIIRGPKVAFGVPAVSCRRSKVSGAIRREIRVVQVMF